MLFMTASLARRYRFYRVSDWYFNASGIVDMATISFTGITIVQGWIYLNNNNDRWHLRLLVRDLFPLRAGVFDVVQVIVLM
jgi:hypothetical protein